MSQKLPSSSAQSARRRLLLSAASVCAAIPAASFTQAKAASIKLATIDPDAKLTTLVNLLTVAPEDCDRLVALLRRGRTTGSARFPVS